MQRIVFLLPLLFLFLVLTVFFHELTHIVLNGLGVDGICFFNCNPMKEKGLLGNGYTPFGVYLSNPKNSLAENEEIAWWSGWIFSGVITGTIAGFVVKK